MTRTSKIERRDATEMEVAQLRLVVDSVPFGTWVALAASAAERFTFYAVSTPWRKCKCYSSSSSSRSCGNKLVGPC